MRELLTTVEASKLAGVGPTAIKRWADEGRLQCVKTAGGHRRFRRSELERLLRTSAPAPALPEAWDDWFDALLDQDGQFRIEAILLTERARLGSWAAVADRLGALLQEIGDRWARGSLTILDEHRCSERLRRAVARIAEALPVPPGAPTCLLATAGGDPHTGGLWLAELALREVGWVTLWGGSPLPTPDLVSAIRGLTPRLVALSGSVVTPAATLATAVKAVEAACRETGAALVLGGQGAWPTRRPASVRAFSRFTEFAAFAVEAAAR